MDRRGFVTGAAVGVVVGAVAAGAVRGVFETQRCGIHRAGHRGASGGGEGQCFGLDNLLRRRRAAEETRGRGHGEGVCGG